MRYWEGGAAPVLCHQQFYRPSMLTSGPCLPRILQIPQLVLGVTTIEEKKGASSART